MSGRNSSNLGAKMMALSVVGILLSFGLCGMGGVAEDHQLRIGGVLFALVR